MRFATPNAKRGPADQPNPVPSSFDATSNNGTLSLPPALERRLSAIEAELADFRRCVVACSGERCTAACWLAEDGAA